MHKKWTTSLSVAALLALSTAASADDEPRRQLECFTLLSIDQGAVMTLPIGKEQFELVAVTLNGMEYAAAYVSEGLEHRWHINPEEGEVRSDYQVILNADLTAGYFDFTGLEGREEREAETVFFCRFPDENVSTSQGQSKNSYEETQDRSAPEISPGSINAADGDYHPIVRVEPVYPARALSRGLEGYVDLKFTVTSTGTVRDPIVIRSTSSLFERAAIRSVLKFKYKPRVVDSVPVDVPSVKTRVEFGL